MVVDIGMVDGNELVRTVFSGLPPLLVAGVVDEGERIMVRASTPPCLSACPVCGASSARTDTMSYDRR